MKFLFKEHNQYKVQIHMFPPDTKKHLEQGRIHYLNELQVQIDLYICTRNTFINVYSNAQSY